MVSNFTSCVQGVLSCRLESLPLSSCTTQVKLTNTSANWCFRTKAQDILTYSFFPFELHRSVCCPVDTWAKQVVQAEAKGKPRSSYKARLGCHSRKGHCPAVPDQCLRCSVFSHWWIFHHTHCQHHKHRCYLWTYCKHTNKITAAVTCLSSCSWRVWVRVNWLQD